MTLVTISSLQRGTILAKNTIKHTRKNKFHKGLHKKKLCQAIWGDSDSYLGGVLGKYIKGKIHDDKHDGETYSERYEKKKFKTSDRKRHESALEKMSEYSDVYEYGITDGSEE